MNCKICDKVLDNSGKNNPEYADGFYEFYSKKAPMLQLGDELRQRKIIHLDVDLCSKMGIS
jgi:hypothetical protein